MDLIKYFDNHPTIK